MGSKEVQNKLQVTWGGQRGKPGKKKTEKEKLKTSQAVKDYYAANPDRRIILSEQMRKAWENPKFLEGMKNSEEIRLQNMKLANCSKDFKRDQSERMKLKWQETEFSSRVREISRRNALNNMDKLHYWASTKEGSEHISKRVKEGWKTEE